MCFKKEASFDIVLYVRKHMDAYVCVLLRLSYEQHMYVYMFVVVTCVSYILRVDERDVLCVYVLYEVCV